MYWLRGERVLRRLFLLFVLISIGAAVIVGTGVIVGMVLAILLRFPSVDSLYLPASQTTRIYAANGELIASLYEENRTSVPLSAIPQELQQAVIDTEDADFYQNPGFSLRGILRAAAHNLFTGRLREGGGTITEQLARNVFLTSEKTITRKVAEILLAVEINRQLAKPEILERYLNQVYLGERAYGVEAAAQAYFEKPVAELTLQESALLAGLIRAPSYYSPFDHPDRARDRMADVLYRMVSRGDITRSQIKAALAAPLHLSSKRNAKLFGVRAPYFISYILPGLLKRYGFDALYRGGLRIFTTLDPVLQGEAQAALRDGIDEALRQDLNVHQGAFVALDPRTGYIRAMVGGYDFHASQFDRAWQAHRQVGSAFKPFTYTAALLRGIPPTHLLLDEPIEFRLPNGKIWAPQDYDRTWHGLVTMRFALANSINAASLRLEQEVGVYSIIKLAHRMGIRSPLQANLALTLGASDVTPLEMATAYGVFASGGVRADPIAVLKVTDRFGRILEEQVPPRTVVLSPQVAYLITDMLKSAVQWGTGAAANIGIPQAGKTGTADDYRNAWFIGYTPSFVAAVWVGNDDDSPMNHVVGGSVPARIWAAFMRQAVARMPQDDWLVPSGIIQATVCGRSGLLAGPDCPDPRTELFLKGTEPESYYGPANRTPPAPPAGAVSVPRRSGWRVHERRGSMQATLTADEGLTLTVSLPRREANEDVLIAVGVPGA